MQQRNLRVKIISSAPCTQPWDAMDGSVRERHCAACGKQVVNFSAMKAQEIERLVSEREGHLCARVACSSDGSIQTLDGSSHPSKAAGVVLGAALALGFSADAQQAPSAGKARLVGTVLTSDGSEREAGVFVVLKVDQQTVALTQTDSQGNFEIAAEPGRYDISIGRNILFGTHISAADLHEGDQSLGTVRLVKSEATVRTVTVGDVVAIYRYPVSYLFKHPIRYLKHLPRSF